MYHSKWTAVKRNSCLSAFSVALFFLCGCNPTRQAATACVYTPGKSATSLSMYDNYSALFLDEATKHPTTNNGGQVVWNTRYYLESLITAYEATHNPKYLQAFEDTGSAVMNLIQTLTVPDVSDPTAPGKTVSGPYINTTGWPTYMGTYAAPISIPTTDGAIALYAQSLYPRSKASYVVISQDANGSLQFAWTNGAPGSANFKSLRTYIINNTNDLDSIAAQPLVYGSSIGRIKATDAGLPAAGIYSLGQPLQMVWQGEQTGGILLPFARFLLIAKDRPGVVDSSLAADWERQVLLITSQYVDQFASDGEGGYTIHNPAWMPMTDADTDAPSDYVFAEASLRILLFELTQDTSQLGLAQGLLQHQVSHNISTSANGWLLVKEWPDVKPWSSRNEAPPGSIWDVLSFDPTTPENSTEGATFVEMLGLANQYGLSQQLGIPDSLVHAQIETFDQYLKIPNAEQEGILSSVRSQYPKVNSTMSDPVIVSDPYASAGYLAKESSDASFWIENWRWMQVTGPSPANADSLGYYLRAWARAEAAFLRTCPTSPE